MNDRGYRNRILAGSVGLLVLMVAVTLIVGRPSVNEPTLTPTSISAAETTQDSRGEGLATLHAWETGTAGAPTPSPTLTFTPGPSPTSAPTLTPTVMPSPTPHPAEDEVWYQDDSLTIFTKDNLLCLLNNGQPPVYLADGDGLSYSHPAYLDVSPDRSMVAFVRSLPFDVWYVYDELWVVNTNGTNPRRLFATSEDVPALIEYVQYPQILRLEWIPQSHLLALTTGDISEGGMWYNNDLYLVDADQGTHQILLAPGDGGYELYPSPDGKQIAVVTPQSISLINVDGSNWRRDVFTYQEIICHCDNTMFVHPVWKLDSSGLLVAVPPPEAFPGFTDEVPVVTTWFIPANGGHPVKLATFNNMRVAAPDNAIFSPDGRYIAYVSLVLDASGHLDHKELHVMRPDGSDDTMYYSGSHLSFQYWDADSKHFVFWLGPESPLQRGVVGGGYEPLVEPEVPEQGCAPGS